MLRTNDLSIPARPSAGKNGSFRRHQRRPYLSLLALALPITGSWLVILLIFTPAGFLGAAPPATAFKPRTMQAFATYVRATDARNNSELQRGQNLLWIDTLPEADRSRAYQALERGELEIERRNTLSDGREIACPGGLIHHWEGVVFITGAHLDDVLEVLQDYDRHSTYYAPDVARSWVESADGGRYRVFLRFRRQKVITVVLNTEHDISYFRDSPNQAHSRSTATHIAEVDNAGKPNEREKAREDDNGFLWGMETWWRLEEKDGGVYLQSEIVSLTRDVPAGLGWMASPFSTSIPKDTLAFTLEATRKAVQAQLPASAASAR